MSEILLKVYQHILRDQSLEKNICNFYLYNTKEFHIIKSLSLCNEVVLCLQEYILDILVKQEGGIRRVESVRLAVNILNNPKYYGVEKEIDNIILRGFVIVYSIRANMYYILYRNVMDLYRYIREDKYYTTITSYNLYT
jgi:hypothetical protein